NSRSRAPRSGALLGFASTAHYDLMQAGISLLSRNVRRKSSPPDGQLLDHTKQVLKIREIALAHRCEPATEGIAAQTLAEAVAESPATKQREIHADSHSKHGTREGERLG